MTSIGRRQQVANYIEHHVPTRSESSASKEWSEARTKAGKDAVKTIPRAVIKFFNEQGDPHTLRMVKQRVENRGIVDFETDNPAPPPINRYKEKRALLTAVMKAQTEEEIQQILAEVEALIG